MIKLIDKYINAIRVSKLNGVIFSIVFAFLAFSTSHTYNVTFKGIPNVESLITSGVVSVILGVIWFFSSLALVKTADRIEERKAEERVKEIAKRRAKAEAKNIKGKKNNKKKKKKELL